MGKAVRSAKEKEHSMSNVKSLLSGYYSKYNRRRTEVMYRYLEERGFQYELFSKKVFKCEIRMNSDIFAMQISDNSIMTNDLLDIVGFFFEHYNSAKNCVWTKISDRIKIFFTSGTDLIDSCGGSVKLNLSDENKRRVLNMIDSNIPEDELELYVEDFQYLETENWNIFKDRIAKKIEAQREKRRIEEVTCMDIPLNYENIFTADERAAGISADSAQDGLIISMRELGRVDIEFISQITGMELKDVIMSLTGAIYQNPLTWEECFYKGWELADEYLSGNIARKHEEASAANEKYDGYFEENVTALEKVMPAPINAKDIYFTLGSPWIPEDMICLFVKEILRCSLEECGYDAEKKHWVVHCRTHEVKNNILCTKEYGTARMDAIKILRNTLNMVPIKVEDKKDGKYIINQKETITALENQKRLIYVFKNWVLGDKGRKERMKRCYEERFGYIRLRQYNGSFLKPVGLAEHIRLYDYQKNAVARIMLSDNTLLAHEVGSGKTYEMIVAGMEMRRTGISKRNFYVVPNSIIGQWTDIFKELYPSANIKSILPKDFTNTKRQNVLMDIKENDYDAVIMAHSSFDLIKMREDNTDGDIYFEDLEINTLFLDEAHFYKNVPFKTSAPLINGRGSKKCKDMMEKVHYIQKSNNGRGVVFATGTPITNSLADIFVMQKYLQNVQLQMLDIDTFSNWVHTFCEKEDVFEIDVDTTQYRIISRISRFHNLTELTLLLGYVSDFHKLDNQNEIPEVEGYENCIVRKTPEFKSFLDDVSARVERIRYHEVSRKKDNMLKVTTDGRKAALDIRLIDSSLPFSTDSKVYTCFKNVQKIYFDTMADKSTQVIFCDTSVPKDTFNIYNELKRLCISGGIREEEIAFVHDYETERKRKMLFEAVNNGDVRIIIGSTFKLGTGTNIQRKLIALHHIDVPWRPSDMMQREGRIIRKGNVNESVKIFRYITDGSFDAYSWQILERKEKIISSILAGKLTVHTSNDLDDSVLEYAQVKAIAVGNPAIKEKVELSNRLSELYLLSGKYIEEAEEMRNILAALPARIKAEEDKLERINADVERYKENRIEYETEQRQRIRSDLYNAVCANIMKTSKTVLMQYQGFDIVLPPNMIVTEKFVWLCGSDRYRVAIGDKESGALIRVDNVLNGLSKMAERISLDIETLKNQENDISIRLQQGNSYEREMADIKAKLKVIDKRLGIESDE